MVGSKKKLLNNKIKSLITIVIVLTISIITYNVMNNLKNSDIKTVKRVLKEKYYEIKCLDSNCGQVVAYKGDKKGVSKVTLINSYGKSVAKYKVNFDVNSKETKEPYLIADNYFIYKIINNSKKEVTGYSIADKKGKEVYKSKNSLKVLTNYLAVEDDTNKGINSYTILDKNGNAIYKNVNDYNIYANNKYVYIDFNGSKEFLDEKGNIIKSGYVVAREISNDNGETIYLILRETKTNSYIVFNTLKGKVISDSFQNYIVNEDNSLTISKKENNQIVQYILTNNGKEDKIGAVKTQSQIVSELRNKINENKYNIYTSSITSDNQKYVFADDIEGKSFGIYNITKNTYKKLFDYKKDATNVYSTLYVLSGENNKKYYQVSCNSKVCDKTKFYIYDLNENKALYTSTSSDFIIQNYYQYTNDYKLLKYSFSSTNKDNKGKYVLLDKNNKEIVKSDNSIIVLNEKLLLGKEINSMVLLYSTKESKLLNSNDSLATIIDIDGNKFYKYDDKNKTVLINEKGEEVLKLNSTDELIYSDRLVVYVEKNTVNILNAANSKINKYEIKKNEKMNTSSGSLISPYRGALFINNSNDNYVKVLNRKGKVIKKIKNAEIQNIYYNNSRNVVIITKNDSNKNDLYGLYIAK